jgi:hypothetical protein
MLEDAIDVARQVVNEPGARVVAYRRPYGYHGSLYAENSVKPPQASVVNLELPEALKTPTGFYYLWRP